MVEVSHEGKQPLGRRVRGRRGRKGRAGILQGSAVSRVLGHPSLSAQESVQPERLLLIGLENDPNL